MKQELTSTRKLFCQLLEDTIIRELLIDFGANEWNSLDPSKRIA